MFFSSGGLKNRLLNMGFNKYQVFDYDIQQNLNIYLKLNKQRLLNNNFTIISDDCWGAYIYTYLNMTYNTPFIWMYTEKPDFYKLCGYLNKYLNYELEFIKTEMEFPVAKLGDVKLWFNHYKTQEDALSSFLKRKERINFDNIFVKATLYNENDVALFQKIPYKNKIAFIEKGVCSIKDKNIIEIENDVSYKGFWQVAQLKSYKYFDIIHWLNTGDVIKYV